MKEFVAKAIANALEEEGTRVSIREDYSGRGMYGKTTFGVVAPDWAVLIRAVATAAVSIAENNTDDSPDPHDFAREMGKLRWDNMGYDIIVY